MISRLNGHRHYIGYRYNPFELEAYEHDADENYLKTRRLFAWVRFMRRFRETLAKDMSAKTPRDKFINY
jgi:hypothetical protein